MRIILAVYRWKCNQRRRASKTRRNSVAQPSRLCAIDTTHNRDGCATKPGLRMHLSPTQEFRFHSTSVVHESGSVASLLASTCRNIPARCSHSLKGV